ncbi:MAG: class GN sortase [Pseudomonadales bacterium]
MISLIFKVVKKSIIALCLVLGGFLLADGGWIYAKALLAQELIERSWQETLETGNRIKPWPWADTWPVARLEANQQDVDLYVLQGTHGSALAFGPGYLIGSAAPGSDGATVIAGHRDTHFRFLRELHQGDALTLTDQTGTQHAYRVRALSIVDSRQQELAPTAEQGQLILVTCYPFEAFTPGGPLRYVVHAEPAKTGLTM